MSVTLTDRAARAAERLIDERVQEMDGDHILAVALGDIRDPEFEAMRELRQALKNGSRGASTSKPVSDSDTNGRSVAIGRHAFDWLRSNDSSLEKRVRETIRATEPRRTLVGLSVSDPQAAKEIASALRTGAESSKDSLERDRLESAARRVEQLTKAK